MSSYLYLAMSLLLEICCCPQSSKAQMLTQILTNKDLSSIFSVKPVLISCSGPDQILSQPYYSETEQDDEHLPAEEDSSSSSPRTQPWDLFPLLCARAGVQAQLPLGQSSRPVPALKTSMWNSHLKQLLQGSKSRQGSLLSWSISFIYQQQETMLRALYSCYCATRHSQHASGTSFSSLSIRQRQSRYTARPTSKAIKMHSHLPVARATLKRHSKKVQIRAVWATFPFHSCGAGLGTRLFHKDLQELLLSWLHRSRLHRPTLHRTSDFGQPSLWNAT